MSRISLHSIRATLLIPQNGNHIYINNSDGSGCNIIGSPIELAFENQKLQMQLEMKDKELALQQREIENLKEIIALLKDKLGD